MNEYELNNKLAARPRQADNNRMVAAARLHETVEFYTRPGASASCGLQPFKQAREETEAVAFFAR